MSMRGPAVLLVAATIATVAAPGALAADFTLVGQFGGTGSGNGQFTNSTDLTLDAAGNVFLVDSTNSRVQRFTGNGTFSLAWGTLGAGAGQLTGPNAVAVDSAGGVYVTELANHRVSKFSSSGVFDRTWGLGVDSGSGTAGPEVCTAAEAPCFGGFTAGTPGAFVNPRGVAVDATGNVFVSEFFGQQRVQKFTSAGAFVTAWGSPGAGSGQFARPVQLAVNSFGEVYVADRDNNRIQRFSNSGAFLGSFGGAGAGDGQLASPQDVAIEPSGNVLVADLSHFRVQRFSRTGAFLAKFDRILPSTGFRPVSLSVNAQGDIYILDGGTNRVLRVREAGAPPPPVVGRVVNVREVSGQVLVAVPAGSARASQSVPGLKGVRFVPITQARQIPVGSLLDTRKGTVRLTSARDSRGTTQSGDFAAGVFQVLQSRAAKSKGLTELRLKGSSFKNCTRRAKRSQDAAGGAGAQTAARRRRLSRRTVRRLRANAKGRFRSRGRYSSATVRGTTWTTTDRCDGTLTKVTRGRVTVRDLRRRKNITLRRGKSYLARARR